MRWVKPGDCRADALQSVDGGLLISGKARHHGSHIIADTCDAAARNHLAAAQAGTLARKAGASRIEPFHFSPRYAGEEERLPSEAERAFQGHSALWS